MAEIAELRLVPLRLLIEERVGIGDRRMGRIGALLAVEVDRGIARIVRRWWGGPLAHEALLPGPGLDEGAVHREVLARQAMLSARQVQHALEEGLSQLAAQRPVAVL